MDLADPAGKNEATGTHQGITSAIYFAYADRGGLRLVTVGREDVLMQVSCIRRSRKIRYDGRWWPRGTPPLLQPFVIVLSP